jgi:hypothetical protein
LRTDGHTSPAPPARKYALAGPVAAAADDERAALLAEVNAGLRPYVDGRGLAFPIESNVVVAWR